MIKLNLENTNINFDEAKEELDRIKKVKIPDFARYTTDFNEIYRIVESYKNYKNLILVGNGGAINSFRGFFSCLARKPNKKNLEILNTIEPDYINDLKRAYKKDDTLLILVSKSGTNPTVLEIMFALWDYPKLIVCTEGLGTLYQIVKREKIEYLKYPSNIEFPYLDDRHTGISSSGLVPAAFFGINIEEIYEGAKKMYDVCSPKVPIEKNPALQLATTFYLLEKKGFSEIFCPVYSNRLFGFLPAIIQFMHETVCKEGKGQSIYGDLAPESQHHTNQRLFGGKKNIIGFFITSKQNDDKSKLDVPLDLTDIEIRSGILNDFKGIPYSKLLNFEFLGTFNDAIKREIPSIHLELKEISPNSVGQFLGFFQYVAVYSAFLRDVNPYGQPQVEKSKEITFKLVKEYYR